MELSLVTILEDLKNVFGVHVNNYITYSLFELEAYIEHIFELEKEKEKS